jgi:hypothetical protein
MDMRPLFKMHANVCQALAGEHRLAIMYSLKEGERRVTDIDEQTVYCSIANPKFMDACGLMRQGLIEEHQAEGRSLQWAAGYLDALEASSTDDQPET